MKTDNKKAIKVKKTKSKDNKNLKSNKSTPGKSNIKYLGGALLKRMARGGASALGSNADEVNKLNVFPVPDGDTGDNMRLTIESGLNAIENTRSDDLSVVMEELSHGMLLGARGNSGVILSQLFAGMAKGLENVRRADAKTMGHALTVGVSHAYSSVLTPTEGTILTVAREAVEYAVSRISAQSTIRSLFGDLVDEMRRSLARTPELLEALKEANVVDSGGAGLLYIMDGFNRVLNGERVKRSVPSKEKSKTASPFGPDATMKFAYCTELLIQLLSARCDIQGFDIEALKDFLASVGDSVVAFKKESIVKVHIHTFTPEAVLGKCREYGEFLSVKIENMSLQHTEGIFKNEDKALKKKNGIVAVSCGDGIESLFKEFGADIVIKGGATLNPSTNDFLEAFSKINAENILVFPNNANIIMAAKQAAELYEDSRVFVVESKSVATGYVAISAVDFSEKDPNKLLAAMAAAMAQAKVGFISPAVRDAKINNVTVNCGDIIGIIDKEIVVGDAILNAAAKKLIKRLLSSGEGNMLTVFKGISVTDDEISAIDKFIKESFPELEYYVIDGRQEIYPYIFLVE
ncbi:MAG: DAK2 domain-containing protein [Clostridia bacterium]|nr:DAK2 domain-containing protein [Clostridia bacterium]